MSSVREVMEERLKLFLAEADRRAGGTKELALVLSELGFPGQGGSGPLVDATIRGWKRGDSFPSPAVVLALAARFGISLDAYVFATEPKDKLAAEVARLRAEWESQQERHGLFESWVLEVGDKVGIDFVARLRDFNQRSQDQRPAV